MLGASPNKVALNLFFFISSNIFINNSLNNPEPSGNPISLASSLLIITNP